MQSEWKVLLLSDWDKEGLWFKRNGKEKARIGMKSLGKYWDGYNRR